MNIVEYPFSATANGEVDFSSLVKELAQAGLSQRPFLMRGYTSALRIGFAGVVSQQDRTLLDALVASHNQISKLLDSLKERRLRDIDIRTSELIATGSFEYPEASGFMFSMTTTAQFNTLVMYTRRNDGNFTYPVVRSIKNNKSSISLSDVSAVEAFYAASEIAVRSVLDNGNILKEQVNDATTMEQVNAVVDNR